MPYGRLCRVGHYNSGLITQALHLCKPARNFYAKISHSLAVSFFASQKKARASGLQSLAEACVIPWAVINPQKAGLRKEKLIMKNTTGFDFVLPTVGHHLVKVTGFESGKNANDKPFYEISFAGEDVEEFPVKMYSGIVPYFMGCMARTNSSFAGKRFSEVLTELKKSKALIDIWVAYDATYGLQVSYSEPRK